MALVEQGVPQIIQRAESSSLFSIETPDWVKELQTSCRMPEQIVIADPLSYCAGVERAITAADRMFDKYPNEPIFFYHAPIHNQTKLEEWEARGAKIVNSIIGEVPFRAPVLLSAHGVSPKIWEELEQNENKGEDTTCPLVDKPHREVEALLKKGYRTIAIGEVHHDEMEGLVGIDPENIIVLSPKSKPDEIDEVLNGLQDKKIAVRTQTTLAYGDIKKMISYIESKRPDVNLPKHDDICYATQNRQEAVIAAIESAGAELMIIFGSDETKRTPSGNSIRQRDVARSHGAQAYLVENITEIKAEWFEGIDIVGIGAGASADPKRVVEFLQAVRNGGARPDQIKKITVQKESGNFPIIKGFDFSKAR